MKYRRWLGKPNPDYGYEIKGFSLSRHIMEIIIDVMFLCLSTRPARWLVERVPPSTIGGIFEKARTTWKKMTHNIKRQNLHEGGR
jgi:hypothetical protein